MASRKELQGVDAVEQNEVVTASSAPVETLSVLSVYETPQCLPPPRKSSRLTSC